MTSEQQVYVYIQLPGTLNTVTAALLRVRKLDDGTYVGRLRYGDRYLQRADAVELDPFHLPLTQEPFEFTKHKGLPGAVRDASPDAWGRHVIEHLLGKSPSDLEEVDYLLHGPQDGAGSLSCGRTVQYPGPSRKHNRTHQLALLIRTAEDIEAGRPIREDVLKQLQPGTSMGGARRKVTIADGDTLWLAKLPDRRDRCNLQRVEFATLALARRCGINTCVARLQDVGGQTVLMLQRFDRERFENGYLRHGLVSGLTVIDADDPYLDRERWSYVLLADELRRWSERFREDAAELFRRMVFNAATTNNDDHPRNHAFLRRERGWRLSPAYDLVPVPMLSQERRDLALTVGSYGRAASLYNIISQSARFGLTTDAARAEFERIVGMVRDWQTLFRSLGVAERDLDYIAPAFLPPSLFFDQPPTAV